MTMRVGAATVLSAVVLFGMAFHGSVEYGFFVAQQKATDGLEFLRVAGGLVAAVLTVLAGIFAVFGTVLYSKAMSRMNTMKAQGDTIVIYEKQVKAWEERDKQREREHVELMATMAEAQKENILLKARTDVSQLMAAQQTILQSQGQMITDARQHDSTVMQALSDFVKDSERRYTEGMKVLNGMLTHLDTTSTEGLTQTKKNYELLESIVMSLTKLSNRMTNVEDSVERVEDNQGQQTVQSTTPPREERRQKPR